MPLDINDELRMCGFRIFMVSIHLKYYCRTIISEVLQGGHRKLEEKNLEFEKKTSRVVHDFRKRMLL